MSDKYLNTIHGVIGEIIASHGSLDDTHVHDTTWRAYWRTVNESNPHAYALAELIALDFRALLAKPEVSLVTLCQYYTMLHDLYRLGAQRDSDVKRFDLNAVIPFAQWLQNHIEYRELTTTKTIHDRLKIGYLCSWAMFTDGNPVAEIVHEAINCHATYANREIYTYLTIAGAEDYVRSLNNTIIRDIRQGYDFGTLAAAAEVIRNDNLDILIADGVGATATYLFMSRVAPIQIYYDYGCPFWSIPQLDWALSAQADDAALVGLPVGRTTKSWSVLLTSKRQQRIHKTTDRLARLRYPADRIIVGCIVRFAKRSEYIDILETLLEKRQDVHVVLVGPGESAFVSRLTSNERLARDVSIVNGYQELATYAPVFDMFLDTFPHSGGAAPIEVAAHGVPIVSMETADKQRDYASQRDPRLVAKSAAEYIHIIEELIDNKEFYGSASQASVELSKAFSDAARMVAATEDGIRAAIAAKNPLIA